MDPDRLCPDCGAASHPIRLNVPSPGHVSGTLNYSLPDARPNFWTSQYPTQGSVDAYLCEQCGRIALYGVPKRDR